MWKGSKRYTFSTGVVAVPHLNLSPLLVLPFSNNNEVFLSYSTTEFAYFQVVCNFFWKNILFLKTDANWIKVFFFDLLLQCAQNLFAFEVLFIATSEFKVLIWLMADFASLFTNFEKKRLKKQLTFLSSNTLDNHWLCAFSAVIMQLYDYGC